MLDDSAVRFAREYYRALVDGYELECAIVDARNALAVKDWDWYAYVLYASQKYPLHDIRIPQAARGETTSAGGVTLLDDERSAQRLPSRTLARGGSASGLCRRARSQRGVNESTTSEFSEKARTVEETALICLRPCARVVDDEAGRAFAAVPNSGTKSGSCRRFRQRLGSRAGGRNREMQPVPAERSGAGVEPTQPGAARPHRF